MGTKGIAKKLVVPGVILAVFWTLAIWLGVTVHPFFIINFGYIGTSLGVGFGLYAVLPREKKVIGRKLAQFMVGGYMLGLLGLVAAENMQIEGFWFYLFAGVSGGAVMHYMVAKIFGPLIFGRAWCGWSCWTAMILDLLPYTPQRRAEIAREARRAEREDGEAATGLPEVDPRWMHLRWVVFGLSFVIVAAAFYGAGYRLDTAAKSLLWLLAGNALYYASGIALAFVLKDNRAFCKYMCPVVAPLKVGSRFALMKMGTKNGCDGCGSCTRACPMGVDVAAYTSNGKRVLSTECMLCQGCANACPKGSLGITFKLDAEMPWATKPAAALLAEARCC